MLRRNCNIVGRKIHDAYFLIDISDNYTEDKCALYEINEVGMFIFNCIDGTRTLNDLVKILQEAIIDEIDYSVLHKDVSEFIGLLIAKKFVEVQTYG